jgi:hypothetical protein
LAGLTADDYAVRGAERTRVPAMRTTIMIAILLSGLSTAAADYLGNLPPGQQPPEVSPNPYGGGYHLYDGQARYRGTLGSNPYDPNRVTNPYGRRGNPYSPYRQDSPNNPYGPGIGVYGNPH